MKVMTYVLLAVAAAWILSGCSIHIDASGFDNCRFQEERSATIPAEGARNLTVLAGAGTLRIEGRPGLTEVRVKGTACAATENLVQQIQIRTERNGDTIRVEADLPAIVTGNSPVLDLALEVPEAMIARIEDSSGDLEVRRIAGAEVRDDSGQIELIDLTGPIRVEDLSGDIEIRNAGGTVLIPRDQSGNIRILTAKSTVTIDRDESGDIEIRDVTGSVTIGEDQSGEITVENVTGNVTIDEDQSGSIQVRDISGDFTVRHDGSGEIRHERVGGTVSIPRK